MARIQNIGQAGGTPWPPSCMSESARGVGDEFPNPTTSSKVLLGNPEKSHAQTLAFPRNSLCGPSNNSSEGAKASWVFMPSFGIG